ncbi:iron export ABC transporter permease subunit FetB [Kurthia sp. Dielmo]|uniref:ABC transporter permease n=1 Tax=Kurthia sp. Dielmo TaxID=1033738 RepID=UPI00112061F4|nr:iron export ABC transporter permease subunit FetB [Kurthia sp. Dielmo]
MTFTTLAITLAFVCIPLVLSKALNLQLGKDVIIATIRAIVQLLAIGYVLQLIFDQQNVVFSFLMVAIMIAVATLNARKKGAQINGITWKLALSLCVVEAIVMSVLVGFHIVPATAQYIIPLSGMAIGNSMVMSILFLNRFTAEIEAHEQEVELILSLGGTPKQAIHRQLITSIKASMLPTIESQKTIGLVQLPGMMSGQIIAGADPVQAVMFQLLVQFMLLTTASVSSVLLGFLSYRTLFNQKLQIIPEKFTGQ